MQLFKILIGRYGKYDEYPSKNSLIFFSKNLKFSAYRLFNPTASPVFSIFKNSSLSLSVATSESIFNAFKSGFPNSSVFHIHLAIVSLV